MRAARPFAELRGGSLFGDFGGRGWEWVANLIAIGGLYLLYTGTIRWQIPVAVLAGLLIPATGFYLLDPNRYAAPGFHLFSGASMLAAFFIATDPVSAAATNRGRLDLRRRHRHARVHDPDLGRLSRRLRVRSVAHERSGAAHRPLHPAADFRPELTDPTRMDPQQVDKPMDEARGGPIRTLLLVGIVAAGAAFMVSASHEFSKDRIAANERARLIASLNSVLDPTLRSHDLGTVRLNVTDAELLGTEAPIDVFVAMEASTPAAIVFASVAPHGYNAAIRMLIGVSPTGALTGVRVVGHRETPGLGDAIEASKSRWIFQFDGLTLEMPPLPKWAVDKDDGEFDTITGATVTSRAVVQGVKNTLLYFSSTGTSSSAVPLPAAITTMRRVT